MRLLEDRGLIIRSDGEPGFGAIQSLDGMTHWAVMPLRLTAMGHDFLDALRNKEVWATLKTGFKDASMGTLMTVSKELFLSNLIKCSTNRLRAVFYCQLYEQTDLNYCN